MENVMKDNSIFKYNNPMIDSVPRPWSISMQRKKLFVYYKGELMPRFTFDRDHNVWKGYGQSFRSVKGAMKYVLDH